MAPATLTLTEELNALDYFEKAVQFMREADQSAIAWKWVVIGLHGALYGFAVSACRGTDSSSVVHKGHLISFEEAIRRCEEGRNGKPLSLSPEERESVRWLKKILRNRFEHYRPCNWTILLGGFPALSMNCVRLIERLANETSMWVHLEEKERKHFARLVAEAKATLRSVELQIDPRASKTPSNLE